MLFVVGDALAGYTALQVSSNAAVCQEFEFHRSPDQFGVRNHKVRAAVAAASLEMIAPIFLGLQSLVVIPAFATWHPSAAAINGA